MCSCVTFIDGIRLPKGILKIKQSRCVHDLENLLIATDDSEVCRERSI